jgi:hypothetical protein
MNSCLTIRRFSDLHSVCFDGKRLLYQINTQNKPLLSYSNNSKICSITFMLVVDIEDVVKKALEELKNNQLISDYEKHEQNITEVLKKAAQKEATLTAKIVHMIENKTVREVEKEMTAIIGRKRVVLIKKSFAFYFSNQK